jgi:uncharacterized repeat protein (TIGR01451 family)
MNLYMHCIKSFCRSTLLGKHTFAIFLAISFTSFTAQAEDVILRHSFAGNMSFELTGNTLRDSNNTCAAISGGESSGSITLPNNSSIKAAYLYWSGSGAIDNTVNFNGQSIASQTDYTEVFDGRTYFSSKADVTSIVSTTSATYRVSGLQFDGSNSYCATEGAYAGWALAIIFEHPDEALRVINVFDGFKNFWGSQFELIPNNFVIAPNPDIKKGKHAHITWEGDAGNSQSRNNFTESLTFEGNNLTGTGNPSDNQFNGYSNVNGSINTSGVDIDEYQIGDFLSAGDTSVHTRYSSGQDAVFLTAEIISVPNEPVADLLIQQSGPANIIRGDENTFNFTVTNNGPNTAPQNSQFSFTIPQGFSYVSQTGSNWNCSTNNNDLSCIYSNEILSTNNSSPLSLTFVVDKTAGANDSINLTGSISGLLFDNILSNNSDQKSYLLKAPDLTSSVKSVIDLNGGNVNPGDTLRYTISINENAGYSANDVSLTDHIDAAFSNYQVVSLPLNAIDNSLAAPNGNSNAGVVQIDDILIAANGSEEVVIDVTLSASLASGSTIDNSALLSSIAFNDVTVSAQTLYTAQPIQSASGNKLLYLNSVRSVNRTSQIMRRNRPTSPDYRNIARNNKDGIWTLNPEFQSTFEFSSNTINFNLCLQSNQNNNIQHGAQVQLLHNTTVIADSGQQSITLPNKNETPIQVAFSLTLSQTPIIPAGDTLKFRLVNITGEGGIRVYSKVGSDFCYVSVPAKTVINVDSISVIDNSNNAVNEISAGSTVSIRSVVSDPFGSFDITSADLTATDSDGNTIFSAQTMSVFNDSGAATKTFNFDYTIPNTAKEGYWKFSVRAKEGEENTIDHRSDFMLLIKQPEPNINVVKSVDVFSDPIHGENTTNNYAKALPGSILTYTISAENTGPGITVDDTIIITDGFPDKTHMLVKDFDDISGQGPIFEVLSAQSSGLTYTFSALNSNSDDLEFSNNDGASFTYSPIPDSDGIDKNITHFRINPKGVFQAPAAGESPTQFTIKFRVRLQ